MEGRNLQIDVRWNPATAEQSRMLAKELIDLRPEVLLTATTRLTRAVQEQTLTIPIVIMGASDPLASGPTSKRAARDFEFPCTGSG
jgi:putative tryptophan/tyrosine transport system substrate-binding protein